MHYLYAWPLARLGLADYLQLLLVWHAHEDLLCVVLLCSVSLGDDADKQRSVIENLFAAELDSITPMV